VQSKQRSKRYFCGPRLSDAAQAQLCTEARGIQRAATLTVGSTMPIFNLVKAIGRRAIHCYLLIALYAGLSLLLCAIGQCLYFLMIQFAYLTTDPWFSHSASVIRMTIILFAAAMFVANSTIFKFRLFRGALQDLNKYRCVR